VTRGWQSTNSQLVTLVAHTRRGEHGGKPAPELVDAAPSYTDDFVGGGRSQLLMLMLVLVLSCAATRCVC